MVFPPERKLPYVLGRKKLEICFGHPIDPANKTADELTSEIRKSIVEMKKR